MNFSPTPPGSQFGPGALTPVAASPLPFNQGTPMPAMPVVSLPKSSAFPSSQTPRLPAEVNETPRKMIPLSYTVPLVSMRQDGTFTNADDSLPVTAERTTMSNQPYQTTVQYGTSSAYDGQGPPPNIQFTIPGLGPVQPTGASIEQQALTLAQQLAARFPAPSGVSLPPIGGVPQVSFPPGLPQGGLPQVSLPGLPQVGLPQLPGLPSVGLPQIPGLPQTGVPQIFLPGVTLSNFGTLGSFVPTILADNELGDFRWNRPNPPQPIIQTSQYRRAGCIGDGSCFFHAVAKGLAEVYQLSYRVFTEVSEATLRQFEQSVNGAIAFPNNLFTIPRSNNLNTRYTFVDQTAANAFRNLMESFRRIYVRFLRQDFANNVLNNDRMQAIIRHRLSGSIDRRVNALVAELFRRLIRLRSPMITEDELTFQLGNYLSGREEYHLDRLVAFANENQQNITRDQVENQAFQDVKNRLAQELLSGNAVQPDFMLLLSDFVGIDIYLLRDADLVNPDPRNTPLYGGAALHRAVHGPANMRPQGDVYEGLPDRKAIVIISVDDFHYEIVARVDNIQEIGGNRQQIHPNMGQEEPLIRRLYEMLTNLRVED